MIRHVVRFGVVRLTIDRPAARNALTIEMLESMSAVFDAAEKSDDTRAVVLEATGTTFSIGGEFAPFLTLMDSTPQPNEPDPLIGSNRKFGTLMNRLATLSVPTIAVVAGAAIGGAVGFIAAADVVLAHERVTFHLPEATMGFPAAQSIPFVAERIGHARALRMAITDETVTATEALRLGLVDKVAKSTSELDGLVAQILNDIGRTEPLAVRATKRIVLHDRTAQHDGTLDFAAQQFALSLRSGKPVERLTALREGREASWHNRLGETTASS